LRFFRLATLPRGVPSASSSSEKATSCAPSPLDGSGLNDKRLFDGSILAVNNTRRGSVETLKALDCLFTVLTAVSRTVESRRAPTGLLDIPRAQSYAEWSAFVEAAKSPELAS
jgi:hypothetical protein